MAHKGLRCFLVYSPVVHRPVVPFCLVFVLLSHLSSFAKEIGPGEDLCRAINDPMSGDEIVLRPGEYRGPCRIRRSGALDRPLVIRAQDPTRRPHVVYSGDSANVLEIHADHVVIQGLAFGPTQKNVDGIRIRSSNDVAVIDCEFVGMGGIAVAANQSNLQGVRVSQNRITESKATAMYFGCHDGVSCKVTGIVVERNFIDGVDAPDPEIGYGLEVKLNSTATIRDNVIVNTKGPGIMVYGSQDLTKQSLVERNFLSGSRTSSGIHIGGGPVVVRNNVSTSNFEAGIGLQDYGQRGLLRNITVLHNTVAGNREAGISAPRGKVSESVIANNAAVTVARAYAFPPMQPGLEEAGNVDCTGISCFQDPEGRNFSPSPKSPLLKAGVQIQSPWMPKDDFFSALRSVPPTAGAIEGIAGPIVLGVKAP